MRLTATLLFLLLHSDPAARAAAAPSAAAPSPAGDVAPSEREVDTSDTGD